MVLKMNVIRMSHPDKISTLSMEQLGIIPRDSLDSHVKDARAQVSEEKMATHPIS